MLHTFLHKVITYPKTVLLLVFIGTLFAFWGVTKVVVNSNFETDLPQDDPLVLSDKRIKEHFGESFYLWIGIKSDNVFQKRTLDKIAAISESVKSIEWVIEDEVKSLTTVNNIKGVDGGIKVGLYLSEIPNNSAAFAKLAADIRADNLLNGHLVSEDGTFTVIAVNMDSAFNGTVVYKELKEIQQQFEGPEEIFLAADFVQFRELDKGINSDFPRLLPIALLLILIGYYFTFRSWRGVWLPFAVVILSIIWTMGAMGWIGFRLTLVTSTLPLLMITVSSSYGIHILHRYYEDIIGRTNLEGVKEASTKIGPAIFMTGVTSTLGTITLLVFKVRMIQEFGIVASVGMLIVLVLSLTFMPAVLALLKREENPHIEQHTSKNSLFTKLANIAIHQRYAVIGVAVVISLVSIWGCSKIKVGDDVSKYFAEDHIINQIFRTFNTELNGAKYIEVMIDTGEEDGVKHPDFLKEVADFQEYAMSIPNVGKTASFADIIKRINQELHESDSTYFNIPETQDAVSQFMLLYSLSGSPGDFSSLVDYDYQRTKLQVMVNSSKQEDHLAIYKALQAYQPTYVKDNFELEFGGQAVKRLAYIKYIVEGKILNIIVAILIVLLICSLFFRSLKMGLIAIIPLLFSTLLTFGLMGFFGIRLEMSTAIITAIGIGIGVDFAIHFIMRFQEEVKETSDFHLATHATMQTAGRAIGFDVLSNVLGFIVLIYSTFLPVRVFGYLVSITMLDIALSTLLIIPAAMLIFKPKLDKQQSLKSGNWNSDHSEKPKLSGIS